ncbi:Leucine rich repeat family protein [Leishmania donovani]|uniref:Leucine rich repeat family protein n=1 Tax=Leishmania donovani TaxID=5661 RepID=A0A504X6M5_LEIDO|nr:Leucine rich repeat family protein [Leishmania donovani]
MSASLSRAADPAARATLSPPLPPRQSIVHGPLPTTTVITIVEGEVAADKISGHRRPGSGSSATVSASMRDRGSGPAPRQSPRRLQPPPQHARRAASVVNDEGETDTRELRQTRSLFLCGRGLLSLRHIQHLPDMLSLRFLSVHMNSIKELESGCLRTLRHLVELDLSANELREIPPGCWDGLGHLERLNLSSNRLTRLGPAAFSSLASLQWLSLGFNSIMELAGLRSVPASAPLAYVDLCANRIATLDEVIDALTPHRTHLQELRLESPSSRSSMTTAAAGSGAFSPPTTMNVSLNDSQDGAAAYWPIEENPCCLATGPDTQDAGSGSVDVSGGAAGGQDNGRVHGAVGSSPSVANYVERLLSYFPRLLVVNGFSYGVDPLHALRQQRRSQEPEVQESGTSAADAKVAAADVSPFASLCNTDKSAWGRSLLCAGGAESPPEGVERLADGTPVSEAFARLLRRPLPHLRGSSSSRSPSSASSEGPKKRRRSRNRHRTDSRHQTRSLSRPRSRSSSSSPLRESSRHGHCAAAAPAAAARAEQDAGWMLPSFKSAAPAAASPLPPQQDPQAASRETREVGEESVVAAGAASKKEAPFRHGRRAAAAKPRRASLRRRSSSNASSLATSPLSGATSSPFAVSPSAPQERYREREPKTVVSSSSRATPHARKLRCEVATLTSATEAFCTPSATPSTGPRMPSADKSSDLAPSLMSPSPADVTDTSDISPPAAAARGQCEHRGSDGENHQKNDRLVATTGSGTGVRVASKDRATLDPPPPLTGVGSAAALRWKPKQVSRGTCTEQGAETLSTVSRDAELAAKVDQLQEQLALRTTTISDLRRHLDLTRTHQVSALKDELARRAEEATILQRKQQAQLNRAVDSVKAEWVRRLEAAEQHSAEAYAEATAAWEVRLARAEEQQLHMQQTVAVKSAQLATLERQTHAMEAEMQAIRGCFVTQQRHWAARTGLLLAEADKRRTLEAAAVASLAQLCRSFSDAAVRLHTESLREAERGRALAEEALREQQATWRAQVAAYEDAMRHAASEVRHAVAGRHGAAYLSPLSPTCALPALPEAPPLSLVTIPSPTLAGVPAPQHEPLALSDQSSNKQVVNAQADMKERVDMKERTPLEVERTAADGSALVSTSTTESLRVAQGEDSGCDAGAECGAASSELKQVVGVNDKGTLIAYWRCACARVEAQLHRVDAALHVATLTQQSMAAENTRLLSHVEALEAEKKEALAARHSTSEAAVQERDNLLRTLHTLRADMERKDAALDALEEEARAKLNEKRHRIAELEDAVEALTTQQARATEVNVSTRGQLEAAQATVTRLQQELADTKERCKAVAQQQVEQVPDLERKQRELSELLATRNAEAHQHQLEKKALVHALTIAREQLVRLYESHQLLCSAHASAREQITQLQAKLDTAQRQVHEVQEATRAKQKATFEVLSHLMTNNTL